MELTPHSVAALSEKDGDPPSLGIGREVGGPLTAMIVRSANAVKMKERSEQHRETSAREPYGFD